MTHELHTDVPVLDKNGQDMQSENWFLNPVVKKQDSSVSSGFAGVQTRNSAREVVLLGLQTYSLIKARAMKKLVKFP